MRPDVTGGQAGQVVGGHGAGEMEALGEIAAEGGEQLEGLLVPRRPRRRAGGRGCGRARWSSGRWRRRWLNIRVLNLSFGTNATKPYTIDPLCHAVEAAWKKDITVVAATGNAGYYMTPGGPGLTSPARDPYVIAVGATDTMKTLSGADDRVASFSSSGVAGTGGIKNPDLAAPGRSIISLAVPGSFIDQTYGAAGAVTGGYMRGSGTSQATAVMSGAAALVLEQHPTWTNNRSRPCSPPPPSRSRPTS